MRANLERKERGVMKKTVVKLSKPARLKREV